MERNACHIVETVQIYHDYTRYARIHCVRIREMYCQQHQNTQNRNILNFEELSLIPMFVSGVFNGKKSKQLRGAPSMRGSGIFST